MKIHILAFLLLFQFPFVCNEALEFLASPPVADSDQKPNRNRAVVANIVLKSDDGGQTWQDISEGLPDILQGDEFQGDGFERDGFFADESGFHFRTGDGIYHSKPNATAPFWEKENFPDKHSSIAPGRNGMFAYNYDGQFLQRMNGTSVWSPVYANFQGKEIRTVFETTGGTVFIGSNYGLHKSTDGGETWKNVQHTRGWVMKLVESNGVLLATSQGGILRSTDDGENWDWVISEGGVGIALERINGGFAAITASTKTISRRMRTSYDGGMTWQPIDAGLTESLSLASIVEVGEYFFCGHPSGVFRSPDKGKTWELILPAMADKVFNLSVSGDVIYAISRSGGC